MSNPSFNNLIRFNAASPGLVDYVVASAVSGCVTPEQAYAIDGKVYSYFARAPDGYYPLQAEYGTGAYSYATHSLARTTIYSNHGRPTSFAVAPIVDVFPSPQPFLEVAQAFVSGTNMLFQQSTAPPGWVKQTTYDDYALRVVKGTAGSGGNNAFSTTFSYRTSDGSSLSIAQLAQHLHGPGAGSNFYTDYSPGFPQEMTTGSGPFANPVANTAYTGSSAQHSHTYDMRVKYVDCIIASKT